MTANRNFWERYSLARASRRRVLRLGAGGGAALAALSIIGCGGDDDDSPSGSTGGSAATGSAGTGSTGATGGTGTTGPSTSGLLSERVDTTANAVQGGEFIGVVSSDVTSFDSGTGQSNDVAHALRGYSRLLRHKAIKYPAPIVKEVEADAATEWEISPDGLTYTFKLRPGFKFDPRPPTNGRVMNAGDVQFSIQRFLADSRNRGDLSNEVDPNAPIVSSNAVDDNTIQIKLAFPYAPFLKMMAYFRYISVMPVEAESGFDVRQTMRGTGTWRLADHQPDVRTVYERNDDWYDSSKVFFDKVTYQVIPENATRLAQFRAGATSYDPSLPQQDLLDLKSDQPELQMLADELFGQGGQWLRFGYLPGSVFLDERVRQAVSMLLDRQLYIDTFGNVEQFANAGLEVPTRWNSSFYSGYDEWIDPQDESAFGQHAKWFRYDPAEAKKLLEAAGHSGTIETILAYPVNHYDATFDRKLAAMQGMLEADENFLFEPYTNQYSGDGGWSQTHTNGDGQWEGIASARTSARTDIDQFLFEWFHSESRRSDFTLANGSADTFLDDLLAKQRGESDPQARAALLKEIQQYTASKMYKIWEPGEALGFSLAQQWIGNWGVYRQPEGGAPESEGWIYHWDKRLA
jgi:ABC-type transport system substrate-binding protein